MKAVRSVSTETIDSGSIASPPPQSTTTLDVGAADPAILGCPAVKGGIPDKIPDQTTTIETPVTGSGQPRRHPATTSGVDKAPLARDPALGAVETNNAPTDDDETTNLLEVFMTGSARPWKCSTAANVGKEPWARVVDFPRLFFTCDDFDEIVSSDSVVCLVTKDNNVPIDPTTSPATPTAAGSVQNRVRPTNDTRAWNGPLPPAVRSPPSMRGGLGKPAAKAAPRAARNAAAVVDSIAPGSIVGSGDARRPGTFRADISHSGATPLPPKGNVGGDNPTAPTYEISVTVDIRVNVHIHLNESMSHQNRPNELNRGGVLAHGGVVPPGALGRRTRRDGQRDLVAAPGAEPQQAQHDDGIVVVDGANVDGIGGVANIVQVGQREEKGSSGSAAPTVVVGEKQHELPKERTGVLSSLGGLLAWGLNRCFVGTGIDCKIEFPATAAGTAATAAGTGTELKVGPCYGGADGAGDGACATRLDPSMHGNIEGKPVY